MPRDTTVLTMILIAGSALALIAGILIFHKPRNKMIFIVNTIIYEIKYHTLGVQEIIREFVHARYNKTGEKTIFINWN